MPREPPFSGTSGKACPLRKFYSGVGWVRKKGRLEKGKCVPRRALRGKNRGAFAGHVEKALSRRGGESPTESYKREGGLKAWKGYGSHPLSQEQ